MTKKPRESNPKREKIVLPKPVPYNPLAKENLGKSVAEALLDQQVHHLDSLSKFLGAGVYAIYYDGDHPAYERLKEANAEAARVPIYVGKAIPSGGRKGAESEPVDESESLWNRLKDHASSIKSGEGIEISDFRTRWLVVDDVWIPLGETMMIRKFMPVWNLALDGFGNHHTGGGRYEGERPLWDTLHPGRGWAMKLKARSETQESLIEKIRRFLDKIEVPKEPRMNFDPSKL